MYGWQGDSRGKRMDAVLAVTDVHVKDRIGPLQ